MQHCKATDHDFWPSFMLGVLQGNHHSKSISVGDKAAMSCETSENRWSLSPESRNVVTLLTEKEL